MRYSACLLIICFCSGYLSTASPVERSRGIPSKVEDNPAIPNDDPPPSPSPDTMSSMINAFKGGMTIDKVINLFKTFRMGSEFFKTLIENVPLANKLAKDMAKRNVEARVLTQYWLNGKFPDLKDIFDVLTTHSDIRKDASAAINAEPGFQELQGLNHKNLTNLATMNKVLQLYFGRKVHLKPSELTGRRAVSIRNMINIIKFADQLQVKYFLLPMFSSDYISVLRYLLSVDYSPLLQIHALPEEVKGGKYTAVNGIQGTDPAVLKLMGEIREKYVPLMKQRKNSAQVEEAVFDILNQCLNILTRGAQDVNKVFGITKDTSSEENESA